MIQAHLYADDYLFDATFDTTEWFDQASDDEILALAKINFGGGPEADTVAWWFYEKLRRVEVVLTYCRNTADARSPGPAVDFTCDIHPEAAVAWLREKRPHLVEQLKGDTK